MHWRKYKPLLTFIGGVMYIVNSACGIVMSYAKIKTNNI